MRRATGRWLLLALFATVALPFLTAACSDDDDDAADPTAEVVDPAAVLSAAADRMVQSQRFHFLLEHENGGTPIVLGLEMTRAEGDVDGTERLSVDVEAEFGPLGVDVSVIILEDESWITNPLTGRWQREDISVSSVFDAAEGVTALLRSASQPVLAGEERISGVPVYRIDALVESGDLTIFSEDAEAGRSLPASAWIGVEDPLVYRLEVTGPVVPGDDEDIVRRIELSRFDEDVEIEPPR